MPIYEYACKSCDHKFEELVRSMSGETKVKCPECGSVKTARALSVFAVGNDGGGKNAEAPATMSPAMCGRCGSTPGSCHSH